MTKEERTKYLGHWSTTDLALKDAYRMLDHLWGCSEDRIGECSTCDYIYRRLVDVAGKEVGPKSE